MSKYRVLQVLDNFTLAGAQRMAVHLTRALDRERFEVEMISLFPKMGTELEDMAAGDGYRVTFLNKKLGFDPRVFFRINRVLKRFRPHVVHTHVGALRYSLPAMLWRRIPAKVHTIHNVADKETSLQWVNRLAFRLGVRPVAIADEVAASMRRFWGIDGFPNIPNGIPVQDYQTPVVPRAAWREREGFSPDDFLFVFVARFMVQKNHKLLLRSFPEVVAADQRARLLLVGDGPLRPELEELIRAQGIQERVHLLGLRTDVADILAAADIFVMSSDWEGNPLTVMEAMAAGKPVVSTDVGGVAELVEDGKSGLIVPPGDQGALVGAMTRVMREPELVERMGQAAVERALDRFDVSAMARGYETLYESMLADGN
ncbi:MAG: glycosyltransferase [Planctomycetes bacterium]|nr:glycosyltransferase [Planctomycetota bacterium]